MGDAFIQGLRYRLPLPKVCRPFGAYNPNNLIPNSRRQYIPKGTSFEHYINEQIKQTQIKINARLRKKLNFSTPKQ